MISPRFLFRAFKYRWRYDYQEFKLLQKVLRPGGVAVDIGAHKGAYLYWMQRWVGHHGKVWAFEPQQELAAYLRHMSRAWPQVRIQDEAVSAVPHGQAWLVLPSGAKSPSPSARLASPTVNGGRYVTTLSLDAWFDNHPPPQVIKCDCEGHELEVFKGAHRLLQRVHPALLFECEARHCGTDGMAAVFDFLHQLGYHGWRVDQGGARAFRNFKPPAGGLGEGNNFWFVKPSGSNALQVPPESCEPGRKTGNAFDKV